MIALALSEDSISKRAQRDSIIESLARLPEQTRKARCCLCGAEPLLQQCPIIKHWANLGTLSKPYAAGD